MGKKINIEINDEACDAKTLGDIVEFIKQKYGIDVESDKLCVKLTLETDRALNTEMPEATVLDEDDIVYLDVRPAKSLECVGKSKEDEEAKTAASDKAAELAEKIGQIIKEVEQLQKAWVEAGSKAETKAECQDKCSKCRKSKSIDDIWDMLRQIAEGDED